MLLQLETCLKRINTFLKLIGLSIDSEYSNKNMLQCLRMYWIYIIHTTTFNLSLIGQIIWFIKAVFIGNNTLLEITYNLPCLTLCLLGDFKVYFFIRHMDQVNEIVKVLRKLQSMTAKNNEEILEKSKKRLTFLSSISKLLFSLTCFAVTAFALGPFFIIGSHYLNTGEIKLALPFLVWYPFDQFEVRNWPFVYFLQLWAAYVAVFSVYGPDCFFYTGCTFIIIQFIILQHDMERIVKEDGMNRRDVTIDSFKAELVQLVNKHRELIRCVNLLETIYSKSTLFNVLTSSLIICATGFNLMALKNLALMTPFTAFLIFGLLQIYFYCYYGDHVMRSSMGVGDAVYKSRWYETGANERKYLLIVLRRTQKPCRLTAYGFTDINLTAFNRILSTSWSYFALLKQMYD